MVRRWESNSSAIQLLQLAFRYSDFSIPTQVQQILCEYFGFRSRGQGDWPDGILCAAMRMYVQIGADASSAGSGLG
jgi:hypothetical protein